VRTAKLIAILTAIWSVGGCQTLSALTDQPTEKTCPAPVETDIVKLEKGQPAPQQGYFVPASDMRDLMHYLVAMESTAGCSVE